MIHTLTCPAVMRAEQRGDCTCGAAERTPWRARLSELTSGETVVELQVVSELMDADAAMALSFAMQELAIQAGRANVRRSDKEKDKARAAREKEDEPPWET